jgi:hypothetical protein
MAKVVSKAEIQELDNVKLINDKRENYELTKLAKPEKKRPLVSAPRRVKVPQQAPIPKAMLESLMKPPPPRYNEYKRSLNNVIDKGLSSIELDERLKSGLVDKIRSSNDIQMILKDKIFDLIDPLASNDFLALVTTIGAFYIENKMT